HEPPQPELAQVLPLQIVAEVHELLHVRGGDLRYGFPHLVGGVGDRVRALLEDDDARPGALVLDLEGGCETGNAPSDYRHIEVVCARHATHRLPCRVLDRMISLCLPSGNSGAGRRQRGCRDATTSM